LVGGKKTKAILEKKRGRISRKKNRAHLDGGGPWKTKVFVPGRPKGQGGTEKGETKSRSLRGGTLQGRTVKK